MHRICFSAQQSLISCSATIAATTTHLSHHRLSSPSMKFTKAILRPIRAAVRGGGGASLSLFTRRPRSKGSGQLAPSSVSASGKKRGFRLENPEPSSPKVTCIGQVRVKSKRRAKQRPIGEISFRKTEHIGDQKGVSHRWVHLPISVVCDALRACAVEFSCCLFPCSRKGCLSFPTAGKNADENGCGAVLGRCLVSVNCGGGGKRREIEVVVDGGDTDENRIAAAAKGKEEKEEEEEITSSRVSICITQENAVLLMRCRSDSTNMAAALTAEYEYNEEEIKTQNEENADFEEVRGFGEVKDNDEEEDSDESNMSSFEALLNQENTEETHEESVDEDEVISDDKETTTIFETEEQEAENNNNQELVVVVKKEEKLLPECLLLMMCEPKLSMEVSKETWVCSTDFVRRLPERPLNGGGCCHHGGAVKRKHQLVVESKPPKPSFPAPPAARKNNDGLQPARSSCSLPAAASMAAVIEQKLLANGAYEPFALTRCKSEPMRTAAAKVMPESCLWMRGGLEQEPLGVGAGAAGVGF